MTIDREHTHAVTNDHETLVWDVQRLWTLAQDLPIEEVKVANLVEMLKDVYCFGKDPTCWDMARHAKQVYEADLSYPIILGADGSLMDGSHRIAKAWVLGHEMMKAVRFVEDPEPDERTPKPPASLPLPQTSPRRKSRRLGFAR